jgi:hypothetical protein
LRCVAVDRTQSEVPGDIMRIEHLAL